jgi:hypothetical protein
MSYLGAFNNQLLRFFEELVESYPEEKSMKMALEAIQGTKKINPKLILDLFFDNVYNPCHEWIENEDDAIIHFAKHKIANEYNEMTVALIIFPFTFLIYILGNRYLNCVKMVGEGN